MKINENKQNPMNYKMSHKSPEELALDLHARKLTGIPDVYLHP
jgi:hypothetical protein